MKNQNDMIISISSIVVGLIVAAVIYFTAPQPTQPQPPATVNTATPTFPATAVVYSNGISSNAGGGMGRGGGFPGGMGMMGGPMMGGRPGMMGGPMMGGRPGGGGPQAAGMTKMK